MSVVAVAVEQRAEAVAVVVEAFRDYPVMRFVIGPAGADYDRHLATLVGFFAAARFERGEPALAVLADGAIVGVALVTPPGERPAPPALLAQRDAVWRHLGSEARARYEAFGETAGRFGLAEPHYHLNMLAVKPSRAGRGYGRRLLDAVHALSAADPASVGVTLSTEDSGNVPLYEHVGYRVIGHARVAPELETWVFLRRDEPR